MPTARKCSSSSLSETSPFLPSSASIEMSSDAGESSSAARRTVFLGVDVGTGSARAGTLILSHRACCCMQRTFSIHVFLSSCLSYRILSTLHHSKHLKFLTVLMVLLIQSINILFESFDWNPMCFHGVTHSL